MKYSCDKNIHSPSPSLKKQGYESVGYFFWRKTTDSDWETPRKEAFAEAERLRGKGFLVRVVQSGGPHGDPSWDLYVKRKGQKKSGTGFPLV